MKTEAAIGAVEGAARAAFGTVTALPDLRIFAPVHPAGLSARARDLVERALAAAMLVALSPLFAMIALLIRLRDPGPVFFGHLRVGRGGRTFRCLKFRTMRVDGDAILARHLATHPAAAEEWRTTRKLRDDPRVSPLGRMLRRTSLDELPQIVNILRGEMALVGPRPIVEEEMRRFGPAIHDYLSVRPGLTGLWQISGRSDLDYGTRVRLDQHYVRTRSLAQDLRILLRTARVVLLQRGSC